MNTDSPTSAGPAAQLSPPQLRPTRLEDYPQVQRLESAYLHDTLPPTDWRGLFLDNPLWPRLGDRWPLGWVLEDAAGRIVGSFTNIPSLYRFRGRELICGNGRGWAVAPEYRGYALWLIDEYFNQSNVDLFINTTVDVTAVPALSTLAARIPIGDWQTTAYWVTGYRGFACKALEKMRVPLAGLLALPAAGTLWVKDALSARPLPPPAAEIATCDHFDSQFDLFWEELVRQNPGKLLGVRDSRALSWHFAIPMRRGHLWIFTAGRNGLLRAYAVFKRQDRREGVRRMRLIDYQSLETDTDLLPGLLQAALRRSVAEGFYILEHLGRGLPKTQSIDRCAPYRHQRPSWPFYYHAADPALDAELRSPDPWDPSEYDGDASFE
jgi:hypothetical protein